VSIVTISRGSFSGGKMIAECVARNLQYRCVDRDVIVERAAAHGASAAELYEALMKPPAFVERFTHKRYLYLTLFQAALAEEVQGGGVVYHGNAGHLMLRGVLPVFRVRIVAPLEFRIHMCESRLKLGREDALRYINEVDQGRKRWTRYLYGVDWTDPCLYDMVLNLETMCVNEACEVITFTVKGQRCFKFESSCQASINNFVLATRVKAALALHPDTSSLEVETEADAGKVWVRGKLNHRGQLEQVRSVAAQVPGVSEMNLEALNERYLTT